VLQKRWAYSADARVAVAAGLIAAITAIVPLASLTGQLHVQPSAQLANHSMAGLAAAGRLRRSAGVAAAPP